MNRLVPWVAGWAALAAAVVAGVPACMVTTTGESPGEVQKQASMVSLMIGNSMGMGQLTEAGLIQIVEDSGGGYVTAISRSGRVGTAGERTTVHAVLGTPSAAELLYSSCDSCTRPFPPMRDSLSKAGTS